MSTSPELISRGEAARIFGVHPATITRWADDGKFTIYRTLGGQRRYVRSEIEDLSGPETREDI